MYIFCIYIFTAGSGNTTGNSLAISRYVTVGAFLNTDYIGELRELLCQIFE